MGCASSILGKKDSKRNRKRAMSTTERVFNAAVLIQKWYRRYLALQEVRRRCSWSIFQSLEYAGEQDQTKVYNFFNDLLSCMTSFSSANGYTIFSLPSTKDMPKAWPKVEGEDVDLLRRTNLDLVKIENTYEGPHLKQPLTAEDIVQLIDTFKRKKTLHAKYVLFIFHGARKILRQKPNINFVSTAFARQITICGDLHGKMEDLFTIFYKNGLPAPDNPYIFNGDYVDRGENSIEILIILLCCLLVWPTSVFLNRGNHEDFSLNLRYGFIKEVMVKYTKHAAKILHLVEDIYGWLPLASIIDNKIFVVHGGVTNDIEINNIAFLNRHQYLTVMRPYIDDGQLMYDADEWKQVVDLLWSDPSSQFGCQPNILRGGGSYFGPDVTKSFLERHHLDMIVRSHECKADGYEFTHDGKVLTIFSASNYYEIGSNRGAYVKFVGPTLHPHIVMYIGNESTYNLTIRQRNGYIEQSAVRELKRKLMQFSSQLLEQFRKCDVEKTGRISITDWCLIMESVTGLNLPWHLLSSRIVVTETDSNTVQYHTTLEDNTSIQQNFPSLLETLYRNNEALQNVFSMIDKDGSGSISMKEFEEACIQIEKKMGRHFKEEDIRDLATSIDLNKDGSIDLNEFLEAFRLAESQQCHLP
ncbi:serine/threonine-protein phosphatase with EF-hands 2-like [Centruroides sculpturatus]|uniref:serine/threonine-protein phosphatase with EF-hands 2-like n=1 Tax=Centruroides sculpturatus TaxID=218467 RepID=UPI000C6E1280|nr:serine/threonine-protein phosphatase with EF-hands 2-like [Centruroides sculpturatus]